MAVSCSSGDELAMEAGAGRIDPSFAVDYAVSTGQTATRSDSEEATVKPDISAFAFALVSDDDGTTLSYDSLEELEAAEIDAASYTITATYGDISAEGVDSAYYAGQTSVTVSAGETATPTLTAVLANTAVSMEYTSTFTQYFTSYSATVASSEGTTEVALSGDSSEWAYLTPGDITLTVSYTKQNGVTGTATAAVVESAQAQAHYHITVDVNGGEAGTETITISFDSTTTTETITIDLGA